MIDVAICGPIELPLGAAWRCAKGRGCAGGDVRAWLWVSEVMQDCEDEGVGEGGK